MTTPVIGQTVLLKIQASPLRVVPAIVSLVIDADTINCDGVLDTSDDWPVGPPVTHPCWFYEAVVRGTGVNEWQESAISVAGPAGATGATGSAGATGATGASGAGSLVTSTGTRSVTAGTAVRPSTTNDVLVTASWKIDTTLSLTGGAAGTVKMFSDAATTPTTEVARVASSSTGTLTVGLNLATSNTIPISYRVKAGDRYLFTTTNDVGTPAFALVGGVVTEQVLG